MRQGNIASNSFANFFCLNINRLSLLIVFFCALSLLGCGRRHTARIAFEITAEADGITYRASNIQEIGLNVKYGLAAGVFGGQSLGLVERGEAIVLDFGSRGLVFVLLGKDEKRINSAFVSQLYVRAGAPDSLKAEWPLPDLEMFDKDNKIVNVDREHLPAIACFKDIQRRETIKVVNPDDLSPCLGINSHIIAATIRHTSGEITEAITTLLPWLKGNDPDKSIVEYGSGSSSYPAEAYIRFRDFLAR